MPRSVLFESTSSFNTRHNVYNIFESIPYLVVCQKRSSPDELIFLFHAQVPVGAVPDGAAGGHGLGLDRHHAQSVQLDLCGGHLRSHLCAQVLEGVGESETSAACHTCIQSQVTVIYKARLTRQIESYCAVVLWPDETSSLILGCSRVRLCRGLF